MRGYARFLDGLACLEDINTDDWFAGNRQEAYQIMEQAVPLFEEARERFVFAFQQCSICVQWLPQELQQYSRPDLDVFSMASYALDAIIKTLQKREAPTLSQVHTVSRMLRAWIDAGEDSAVALRGTPNHFPVGAI